MSLLQTLLLSCGGEPWVPTDYEPPAPRPNSLVLGAGQSNMLGGTAGPNALDGFPYPTDMPYAAHLTGASNPPLWQVYDWAGLGPRETRDGTNTVGPEIDLGRRLEEVQPGKWRILKWAVSSASLATHYDPDGTYPSLAPPNLFTQMVNRAKQAEIDQDADLKFVAWSQGEADASNLANANAYAANMIAFLAALRVHFPTVQIVLGRLNDDFSGIYRDIVRAQQDSLALEDGFHVVDLDPYTMGPDNIHYPVSQHLLMGRLYADAYFAANPP